LFSLISPFWRCLRLGCMDAHATYPLVVRPAAQGLVPRQMIGGGAPFDDETQADLVDRLQQAVARLCQFVLSRLSALQVLRLQVIDQRCRANYWQAQHRRAREREDNLTEQKQLLQGEIRELKRRLFGRQSETASATQPT